MNPGPDAEIRCTGSEGQTAAETGPQSSLTNSGSFADPCVASIKMKLGTRRTFVSRFGQAVRR